MSEEQLWCWWLIDDHHLPRETDTALYNRQQIEALSRVREKHAAAWIVKMRSFKEAYLAKAQTPESKKVETSS